MVESTTDNRNRTAAQMRHIFDKGGGQLGASGCVAWMFDRKGILLIEQTGKIDEDELMMEALNAGASDVLLDEDVFEVQAEPADFPAVRDALEAKGYAFLSAQVQWIPQNTVTADKDLTDKLEWIIDHFEDDDDVQNVYHNADLLEQE
jgi:YebC/PmpR family DNA-binding regulatory protein